MNGYERALSTLEFEKTDRVATWGGWIVSAEFFEYVTGKSFWDDPRAVAVEAYRKLEADIILQTLYLPAGREEWRTLTDETLVGEREYPTPESVMSYIDALPDPGSLESNFDFETEFEREKTKYLSFQEELGPDIMCLPRFSCARFTWYMLFGYESYLSAMALYPDAIRRLFEFSAEENRLSNMVRAELVKHKVLPPYFLTGHDICGTKGPIVSPESLRDLYFPSLARSVEPLVEIDADLIWHSDGFIPPILDDLVESGMTGFQGFQENTGFDISEVAGKKTRKGKRPLLLAGLSITGVLPFGSVRDTEREVERIIDSVGSEGGLAIGTANTAGPDCKSENLEALYRHTHTYRPGK